jgi:hypothetical protein
VLGKLSSITGIQNTDVIRWYNNKNLDLRNIPSVEAREAQFRRPEADLPTSQQTPLVSANPLEPKKLLLASTLAVPQTQTVPARTVFHEATAALGPLMNGIQTQEQLDTLLTDLEELR